jgi:hypothetical protein
METTTKTIKERVEEAIASGEIAMKPKWYFALQALLFALGVAIASCATLYLASFILFVMRENGLWFVPTLGPSGWYVFLVSLPWLLVLLLGSFVVVLELMVRRYSFAYRRPLVISVVGVLALVVIGGACIEVTPLHRVMVVYSERSLPVTRDVYRHYEDPQVSALQPGRVVTTTADGFILFSRRGDILHVAITPDTKMPPGFRFIEGDEVLVFGEKTTTSVKAFGIKLLRRLPR